MSKVKSKVTLWQGDCLELMGDIPDGSIDCCITDPPYGTTQCKWDSVIPFEPMWAHLKRIIKPNGAIVLFGVEPFSTYLRMSNMKNRRHEWYWNKNNSAGFALAKFRPFQIIENLMVFGYESVRFYPQMEKRGRPRSKGYYSSSENYGIKPKKSLPNNDYYPKNLLTSSKASQSENLHPTQKPVDLIAYLIKTYTLEGESILDFTMGSGTTGVAAKQLGRHFVGIEKDPEYFKIAQDRIAKPVQVPLIK